MTSEQAAALLGITEHSLRTWRYEKRGPQWHTLGRKSKRKGRGSRPRVFYYRDEVEKFLNGGNDGKGKG